MTLPGNKGSVPTLVAASRRIADVVAPHASVLIAAGLAPDFVGQLNAAVAALEAASGTVRSALGARVAATQSLGVHERMTAMVLRTLDRQIRAQLGKNDPALAEWNSMRRVVQRSRVVAGAATTTSGAPTTAAAAVAVATPVTPTPSPEVIAKAG